MLKDGTLTSLGWGFKFSGRTIEIIKAVVSRKEQGQKNFHFLRYKRNNYRCFSIRCLNWQVNFEKDT